jgi:hypothetical protein
MNNNNMKNNMENMNNMNNMNNMENNMEPFRVMSKPMHHNLRIPPRR